MPAHLRAAFAGAGLAALTLAGLVAAQQPKPADVPARPSRGGETTLFMLVRTGPHLTPDNLSHTLEEGLTAAHCMIEGKPTVRAVSPAVFDEIEAVTNPAGATPEAAKSAGGLKRITS